jgi:hypothetical protein
VRPYFDYGEVRTEDAKSNLEQETPAAIFAPSKWCHRNSKQVIQLVY